MEIRLPFILRNNRTKNDVVNNPAYFIDKGSEVIFMKGNSIKSLIYGLVIFCALFIVVLVILKKKEKLFDTAVSSPKKMGI